MQMFAMVLISCGIFSFLVSELNSIIRQLYSVSNDISRNISGMNIKKYTRSLEKSAEKYQKAVNKLHKIK